MTKTKIGALSGATLGAAPANSPGLCKMSSQLMALEYHYNLQKAAKAIAKAAQ